MKKQPNLFAGAPCTSVEHEQWMRVHHGSQWDWMLPGEDKLAAAARRKRAAGICFSCSDETRQLCRDLHARLEAASGLRVPGVWGGRIYRDKEPIHRPNPDQLSAFGDAA